MSGFSLQPNTNNSKKTPLFSSLLLSDLFLFCSFILSHPLYFCYFIFFSPYILKILSFLSPLFITTFLLLVSLFTTLLNDNSNSGQHSPETPESKIGFLLTTYNNVLEKLRPNAGDGDHDEFQQFEELEAYKMVFEASTLELLEMGSAENSGSALEEPDDKYPSHESLVSDDQVLTTSESLAEIARVVESETLELNELKENDESVDEKKEKEVNAPSVESNKGEEPSMKSGSKALSEVKVNGAIECMSKVRSNSQRHDNGGDYGSKFLESSQPLGSNTLGNFGSMRKEKEWKRTLACKLFEERHCVNVDGGAEGMDLLWETYETDSNKVLSKSKTSKGKKSYHEEEEEDDDDGDDGQLCCLQALKFSAGKMNLGMGRPNLVKISKALKGFGWLHHVTKHGSKKVYP